MVCGEGSLRVRGVARGFRGYRVDYVPIVGIGRVQERVGLGWGGILLFQVTASFPMLGGLELWWERSDFRGFAKALQYRFVGSHRCVVSGGGVGSVLRGGGRRSV